MKEIRNLIGSTNAGFLILAQGEKAVAGIRPKDGLCVAWSYHFDKDGNPSYYWGRYGDRDSVNKCYDLKEAGLYSGGDI